MKDHCPENNRDYGFVLLVIDTFSKFGWTFPLKNENAQTKKLSFEIIIVNSKRKPNLTETDNRSEFVSKIFTDLLNRSNIKVYSRYGTCERFITKEEWYKRLFFLVDIYIEK